MSFRREKGFVKFGHILSLVFICAFKSLFYSVILHINLSFSLIVYRSGALVTSNLWNSKCIKSKLGKWTWHAHQVTNWLCRYWRSFLRTWRQPYLVEMQGLGKDCEAVSKLWLCFRWCLDQRSPTLLQVQGGDFLLGRASHGIPAMPLPWHWLSSETGVTGIT